jgi:hypothetical protein
MRCQHSMPTFLVGIVVSAGQPKRKHMRMGEAGIVVWSLTARMSDGVDDRYFCLLPPRPHRYLPFL